MKTFKDILIKLKACESGRDWVGDKTVEEFVKDCQRGDWMLWLAKKLDVGIKPLTLTKGYCAKTVEHLMKDERSKKAVQAAIDFGKGKITKEELDAAAYADAYDAATAAAYAAYAAAYAAYAAADAADTADTADDAAYAAYAAADTAADDARTKNRLLTADICRKYIGQILIDKVNILLK
jgi:hypothetical protein